MSLSSFDHKFYRTVVLHNPAIERYLDGADPALTFFLAQRPVPYDEVMDAVVSVFAPLFREHTKQLVIYRAKYHSEKALMLEQLQFESITWEKYTLMLSVAYRVYVRSVMNLLREIL